jgi:putative ABC transport system permease protein
LTGKLVLENLKHKPMRSLLSILLIGVPVTLILCLVGLSNGLLEDSQRRARGTGADIMVRPPGSSVLSLSGAPIPEALATRLQAVPHVKMAVGVVSHPIQTPLLATGVSLKEFDEMSGGFTYLKGHAFDGPDQVIIDDPYARQKGVTVGQKINLLNKDWTVVGIIAGGKLARIVFPIDVLQDLSSTKGKLSQIYLKLDDPANTESVIAELKKLLETYQVYSMEEFTAYFSVGKISGLREFIIVIVAVGVLIGFAVVCLSMYMAVLQRTREIGILKSLGASKGFILGVILAESVLLGIGGTAVGVLLSFGAWWLIRTLVPASIPMLIVPVWWLYAGGITLIGTVLGALYPGLSAARHDPIEALSYE